MLQPGKTQHIIQIVKHGKIVIKHRKTAGAVLLQTASTNTERMQLFCNTHIYPVCHYAIMPFHQPGTGRQKNMNFTHKLILDILFGSITNCKGFLTKKTKCQSICYLNYIENKLVIVTNDLRYQRDP